MRTGSKLIIGLFTVLFIGMALPSTSYAQEDGGGVTGPIPDPTSGGLPRDNLGTSPTPGSWLSAAAARFSTAHSAAIDQFGGVEYSQEPSIPRRRTFLFTFLPNAFAILNELIQTYILAVETGTLATG